MHPIIRWGTRGIIKYLRRILREQHARSQISNDFSAWLQFVQSAIRSDSTIWIELEWKTESRAFRYLQYVSLFLPIPYWIYIYIAYISFHIICPASLVLYIWFDNILLSQPILKNVKLNWGIKKAGDIVGETIFDWICWIIPLHQDNVINRAPLKFNQTKGIPPFLIYGIHAARPNLAYWSN